MPEAPIHENRCIGSCEDDMGVHLGAGFVRRLVAERRIPFLKWGHLLRFDPHDIEAWLDGARRH